MEQTTDYFNRLAANASHDISFAAAVYALFGRGKRMRVISGWPLAVMGMLAACDSSPKVTANNATPQEVQQKVAAAGSLEMISPGRWEGVVHIAEMTMPGLPPEAQAQMAKARGDQKIVSCVTPEDVKESKGSMFGGMGKECKYDHFALGGGKIDGTATCDAGGAKMKTTVSGTFSSDTYHLAMHSEATGAKPMSGMTMTMSVDAKRTGACRGTPDES
jgi:hypothetical protein